MYVCVKFALCTPQANCGATDVNQYAIKMRRINTISAHFFDSCGPEESKN